MHRYLKYFILMIISFRNVSIAVAQLGDPVLSQTFGVGNDNPNTVGPPLRAGSTFFTYSTELCPPPGSYTIVRRMNIKGCFNGEWIPLSKNNTPVDYGMMMMVNNNTDPNNRIVYVDTTRKNLCPGTTYRFSIAIINIDEPSSCQSTFPVFEFRIEDGFGNLIIKDTTRPAVNYAPKTDPYEFNKY